MFGESKESTWHIQRVKLCLKAQLNSWMQLAVLLPLALGLGLRALAVAHPPAGAWTDLHSSQVQPGCHPEVRELVDMVSGEDSLHRGAPHCVIGVKG